MSTVTFKIVPKVRDGKKQMGMHAPVYVRYQDGRRTQVECKTPIMVLPKDWNSTTQRVKNTMTSGNVCDKINTKLLELAAAVMNEANMLAMEEEEKSINSILLRDTVDQFFKMTPRTQNTAIKKQANTHLIYLTDYMQWWIDNKQETYITRKNKRMSKSSKDFQGWAMRKLQGFETTKKRRIKFKGLDKDMQTAIISYFLDDMELKQSSLNGVIKEVKFFTGEAAREKIAIHPDFPSNNFKAKRNEDRKERAVTLDLDEIQRIYNYDFSFNPDLDAFRDYFIIGLNTGMRVSDFYLTLEEDHIHNGRFLKDAVKTGVHFQTPIFDMVREVLDKWDGLPPKKDQKNLGNMRNEFNNAIREICKMVGIDQEVMADHFDPEVGRKVYGKCKKYEAITSHICRRSFITNMDKMGVRGEDIDAICGLKTASIRLGYTKTTGKERADRAKRVFDLAKADAIKLETQEEENLKIAN